MSCLSADWQATFLKLGAECLPFSQCTNCGDLRASPRTWFHLATPWKEAFSPQISPCLLQNSKRSPLIGGLGALKAAGVSEKVMNAMLKRPARGADGGTSEASSEQ